MHKLIFILVFFFSLNGVIDSTNLISNSNSFTETENNLPDSQQSENELRLAILFAINNPKVSFDSQYESLEELVALSRIQIPHKNPIYFKILSNLVAEINPNNPLIELNNTILKARTILSSVKLNN